MVKFNKCPPSQYQARDFLDQIELGKACRKGEGYVDRDVYGRGECKGEAPRFGTRTEARRQLSAVGCEPRSGGDPISFSDIPPSSHSMPPSTFTPAGKRSTPSSTRTKKLADRKRGLLQRIATITELPDGTAVVTDIDDTDLDDSLDKLTDVAPSLSDEFGNSARPSRSVPQSIATSGVVSVTELPPGNTPRAKREKAHYAESNVTTHSLNDRIPSPKAPYSTRSEERDEITPVYGVRNNRGRQVGAC